jgi:hypothetical protein
MNTSGVAEPPEIVVTSVARFVSVSFGADVSETWIFGYCFWNAAISAVRVSPYLALVVIGLAHQLMEPDVALPGADDVPPAGAVALPPAVPLVVVLLLLQPAAASAPTAPTMTASCQVLMERRAAYLRDSARAMRPPTYSSRVDNFL